jgi:hypothetical protein
MPEGLLMLAGVLALGEAVPEGRGAAVERPWRRLLLAVVRRGLAMGSPRRHSILQ